MKWIKRLIIALIVLLAVILVCASFFMGTLIKTGVNTVGPHLLGVPVTLEQAAFFPIRGKATLKNLVVGNPEGFNTSNAFELVKLYVHMDVASLLSDKIVIEEIDIQAPVFTYEKSLRSSNIATLLEQLEGASDEGPDQENGDVAAEKSGPTVQINDFIIEDAQAKLSFTALGGAALTIPLPTIRLEDIGNEEGGTSAQEVVREVCSAILSSITEAMAASGELIGDAGKAIGKGIGKDGEVAQEAFTERVEAVEEAAAANG